MTQPADPPPIPVKSVPRFVAAFRAAAPYIHSFRGKTFVIAFGGEVVSDGDFTALAQDLNLLASLGIRIVLVHGVRPQVEEQLASRGAAIRYVRGLRVTDDAALLSVKEAVGSVRVEIEAALSQGLPNTPMAGAQIRVASGNFVTARPIGIVDGEDLLHTGEVRKVDASAIHKRLDDGEIVLLSPLGYSPTGETFNLTLEDVATEAAIALGAHKLVFLMDDEGMLDARGRIIHEMTVAEAERLIAKRKARDDDVAYFLPEAIIALRKGVPRAHLVNRHKDGALLLELFTHEGVGTLIAPSTLEALRPATVEDLGAIATLIAPLEEEGVLVSRSRDRLETEIAHFTVIEHDGVIVGCLALHFFPDGKSGEAACLAVHPDYRDRGYGDALLDHVEAQARKKRLKRLFVLTTRTAHWFIEHGYATTSVDELPAERRATYSASRNSKVMVKKL